MPRRSREPSIPLTGHRARLLAFDAGRRGEAYERRRLAEGFPIATNSTELPPWLEKQIEAEVLRILNRRGGVGVAALAEALEQARETVLQREGISEEEAFRLANIFTLAKDMDAAELADATNPDLYRTDQE
jgi:hypothetical protein